MGLDALSALLKKHSRIGLDTNIFIYQLEEHPKYLPATSRVFQWLERTHHTAVTSTVTFTELLTNPYAAGDNHRANLCYGLLSRYPNLEWAAPSLEIADLAARFRADYRLRTPDAIQAATVVRSGAHALLSNDPAFRRVKGLETLVLDDLI